MKKTLQRGFTLIELLVVIAIIGILAAVVLTNLGDARDSGRDAAALGSMNAVRSQMELLYNQTGFSYDGSCAVVGGEIQNLLISIAGNTGVADADIFTDDVGLQGDAEIFCNDSDDAWVVQAPLNKVDSTPDQIFFCVDSTGTAAETITPIPALAGGTQVCAINDPV